MLVLPSGRTEPASAFAISFAAWSWMSFSETLAVGPGEYSTSYRFGRFLRGVPVIGDDHRPAGNGVGRVLQDDGLDIAFDLLRRRIHDIVDLRSVPRRRQDRAAIDHALDFGVDAVDGGAGRLLDDVERGDRLADQLALGDRLQRDLGELFGRVGLGEAAAADDVRVGDLLRAGDDLAVGGRAGCGIDAERFCAGLDQRHAAGGAGLAVERIGLPDGPASAGDHQAPLRIRVDVLDAHIFPRRFEFIGEDARERRADMLAHLGADDVDGDDAVRVDRIPLRRLEGRGVAGGFCRACGEEGEGDAGAGGGDEEAAAAEDGRVHWLVH